MVSSALTYARSPAFSLASSCLKFPPKALQWENQFEQPIRTTPRRPVAHPRLHDWQLLPIISDDARKQAQQLPLLRRLDVRRRERRGSAKAPPIGLTLK